MCGELWPCAGTLDACMQISGGCTLCVPVSALSVDTHTYCVFIMLVSVGTNTGYFACVYPSTRYVHLCTRVSVCARCHCLPAHWIAHKQTYHRFCTCVLARVCECWISGVC